MVMTCHLSNNCYPLPIPCEMSLYIFIVSITFSNESSSFISVFLTTIAYAYTVLDHPAILLFYAVNDLKLLVEEILVERVSRSRDTEWQLHCSTVQSRLNKVEKIVPRSVTVQTDKNHFDHPGKLNLVTVDRPSVTEILLLRKNLGRVHLDSDQVARD